jgi:uncharacterized protein (DUF2062 family)
MREFFRQRVINPLRGLLMQGLSPHELALCLALGAGVGVFPILGVSTPLLTCIAIARRLNIAVIQLVSYLVAPVQLALFIPFVRAGEWVIGAPRQPITLEEGMRILADDVWQAIVILRDAILHASIGWLLIGPPIIYILYRSLIPVFEHTAQRLKMQSPP